jgi:hypothetical protein
MKKFLRKPLNVFFTALVLVSIILCTVPINLFDGEVVYLVNGVEFTEKLKMSLCDFTGLWTTEADLKDVKEFHLVGMGYLMAFLMIVCLPALIAYRVWIGNQAAAKNNTTK